MRYTFLLYSDETNMATATPEQRQQQLQVFGKYIGALKEAGVFVDTDWLKPSQSAKRISLRGGERVVQDGPYADTKEQMGGYFVVDVPDFDAALAWAEKCPVAQVGIIEVRPSAMPTS